MELGIDVDEAELVREILAERHRELLREISRSRHHAFRDELRRKEMILDTVIKRLAVLQAQDYAVTNTG